MNGKSHIDAVWYASRRHGRATSLLADDVSRSTGRVRGWKERKGWWKVYEREWERERFAEISLFLLAPTVISAKLKLPKEVSFASVNPPTRLVPPQLIFFVSLAHFTLVRRPPHARHFFASCQPTSQPAKSFSDVAPTDKWSALRLPACGHYWSMRFSVFPPVFLSSFFTPLFFSPSRSSLCASFHRLSDVYALSSLHWLCLHFILRHAPLLSFSFPEDTHSFVTIVGNGEEVAESMASASSWLVLILL